MGFNDILVLPRALKEAILSSISKLVFSSLNKDRRSLFLAPVQK
jgi:hypothetical protein